MEGEWSLKNIDWKFVFGKQHYGVLLFTLFPILALALVLWVFSLDPELTDQANIILRNEDYRSPKKSGTIPAVIAVLVPFFIFLIVLFICELWFCKRLHGNITNAVYSILYFIINWFCAFAVHICCQQISSIEVAEPRPDFGSRCQLGDDGDCSRDPDDGLSSYFSGHASSAILSAVYSSIYLLWVVYFRSPSAPGFLKAESISEGSYQWHKRFIHEISHASVLYVICAQLGFAWIVGTTRIIDNRHHIWDVTAGYFVGTVVAAAFSIQAIGAFPLMPKKSQSSC
eukprot:g8745.t1